MSEYLRVIEIGGVMWCIEHRGLVDECSDTGEHCDMSDGVERGSTSCDFRNLYIADGVDS